MKNLVLITLIMFPAGSKAMCLAPSERLFQMEVWRCQSATFQGDERIHGSPDSQISVQGVLITGEISEVLVVREGHESTTVNKLRSGETTTIFLSGQATGVCPAYEIRQPAWFEEAPICCDVMPARGLCLVPNGIPLAEPKTEHNGGDHEARSLSVCNR